MIRRWLSVALAVAGLGTTMPAWAQAPLPDPIPFTPTAASVPSAPAPPSAPYPQAGPSAQAPLVPQAAPYGPGAMPGMPGTQQPDLTLSPSIPGAFTDCPPDEDTGVYFHVGGMALMRDRPGRFPLAVIDHRNPTNLDTGAQPTLARFTTVVQDFHDLDPDFSGAIRTTLGYLWDAQAVEFTGWYLFNNDTSVTTSFPGRLDSFFNNMPLGFEGDNGLWLQADQIRTTLRTTVGNAEINYRWWNQAVTGAEALIGVRYFDEQERLNIFTDDDGLTIRDINGNPDPTRQATFTVRTHNRLIAPQVGFEWHWCLCSFLQFSGDSKLAGGINLLETDIRLVRGDGFAGESIRRHDNFFSYLYEGGVYLDFWLLERARLRAGYTILFLGDIAQATDQVDFNLRPSSQRGFKIQESNTFYHGPVLELQFLF